MKKQYVQRIVLAMFTLAVAVGAVEAQQRQEMTAETPKYDRATEETVQGVVVTVVSETNWTQRMRRPAGPPLKGTRGSRLERVRMAGSHVLLDTPQGDIEVHIAPTSFLTANGFEIARHEVLDVVGSRITVNGEAMIVAREIAQGGRTLTLRGADGTPRW